MLTDFALHSRNRVSVRPYRRENVCFSRSSTSNRQSDAVNTRSLSVLLRPKAQVEDTVSWVREDDTVFRYLLWKVCAASCNELALMR